MSAATPSIKGSAFSNIVAGVLKLVERGQISREELAKRLEPGDLEVIESRIGVADWYDIRLHVRLLQTLEDVGGPGHAKRTVEAGADRLLAGGLYQQLTYLSRTQVEREKDPAKRLSALGSDLRLIVSISSMLLNFSRWEPKLDPESPDRYMIEISEAGPFRDLHLSSIQAFINRISSNFAAGGLWRWERRGTDRVVFRMTRGVADL